MRNFEKNLFWQGRRASAGGAGALARAKKRAQCNREVDLVRKALETGPRYWISIKVWAEAIASDQIGDVGSS
jgi:hypothetical protein